MEPNGEFDFNSEIAAELTSEEDGVTPSMWDAQNSADQGNDFMADWEGRKETHNMFLQSYD
ncbi:hypothetical protein [Paenibacillus crassostreae]|uniref:Uncharacterized protein n=1 Tax=Paenibacillus crassostreae TaxID=1763538 RepID=A0A162KP61_9BACL|nr:hypothetical protein [Paenibacillus crassostreae]AOZ93590.1 hypothetical protein LPB68_16270 [Paenibacillus crassostreae]OAB71623.1 hypothetical protein PNBC_19140 [Paenibacillus crassostreae]